MKTFSLVRTPTSARPGMSGSDGRAPVAMMIGTSTVAMVENRRTAAGRSSGASSGLSSDAANHHRPPIANRANPPIHSAIAARCTASK